MLSVLGEHNVHNVLRVLSVLIRTHHWPAGPCYYPIICYDYFLFFIDFERRSTKFAYISSPENLLKSPVAIMENEKDLVANQLVAY